MVVLARLVKGWPLALVVGSIYEMVTKGFAEVKVASAEVRHTIDAREVARSFCGDAVTAGGRGGKDGEGVGFRDGGGKEEVVPSGGKQEGRSQHKSVFTPSCDSEDEHPP